MSIQPQAFTVRYNGKVNPIVTQIALSCIEKKEKFESKGLWDTGATGSAITKSMAEKIGLMPVGQVEVGGVHGVQRVNWYFIHLEFYKGNVTIKLKVTECKSLGLTGAEMLIGMDVILLGDFAITNNDGKTTMSYRLPSGREIDFVKEIKSKKKYNESI